MLTANSYHRGLIDHIKCSVRSFNIFSWVYRDGSYTISVNGI